MITTLFSAVANVVRTNYLIPTKKDNIYVKSTLYGALANLILNIKLIKKYGSYGACIGTIVAELILMVYQSFYSKNAIDFSKVLKLFLGYLGKSLIIGLPVVLLELLLLNGFLKLILQIIIAISLYLILNYKYIIYDFLGK